MTVHFAFSPFLFAPFPRRRESIFRSSFRRTPESSSFAPGFAGLEARASTPPAEERVTLALKKSKIKVDSGPRRNDEWRVACCCSAAGAKAPTAKAMRGCTS